MIRVIEQRATGCTFEDWQDVLHEDRDLPEDTTVGNYRRDGLTEEEECCLDLEAATNGLRFFPVGGIRDSDLPVPDSVKHGRGVGNWRDPKVVLLVSRVEGRVGPSSLRWRLPAYRRLRPFSSSQRSRKFLHDLLSCVAPWHAYVTAVQKEWLTQDDGSLLRAEMSHVKCDRIIALGAEVASFFCQRISGRNVDALNHPVFWTTWHGQAWVDYRERFREMVTGGEHS